MKTVVISGSLDDLRSDDIRFLEEASNLGHLHALLWTDETVCKHTGKDPKFPQDERRYVVQSIRFVKQGLIASGDGWMDAAPEI